MKETTKIDRLALPVFRLVSTGFVAFIFIVSTAAEQSLSVSVSEPFTILESKSEGEYLIHPHLTHYGDGKLLLQVSPDTDIFDEEQYILSSSDGGKTWNTVSDWPLGDGTGRHNYGYRRPDPEVEVPHAIEGVFIDVSTAQ